MDEPAANDHPVEGVTDQSQEVGNPVLLSVKLTVLFVATLTEETLLPFVLKLAVGDEGYFTLKYFVFRIVFSCGAQVFENTVGVVFTMNLTVYSPGAENLTVAFNGEADMPPVFTL